MRPCATPRCGPGSLLLLLAAAALSGGGAGVAAQEGNGGEGGVSSTPLAPSSVLLPRAEDLALEVVSGNGQFWYLGRQLRAPMVFRVSGPGVDARSCSFIPVGFSSEDADRVTPLVGDPVWEAGECRVNAWWSLGTGVGRQLSRAEILGEGAGATGHAPVPARARSLLRGAGPPAGCWADGDWRVEEGGRAAPRGGNRRLPPGTGGWTSHSSPPGPDPPAAARTPHPGWSHVILLLWLLGAPGPYLLGQACRTLSDWTAHVSSAISDPGWPELARGCVPEPVLHSATSAFREVSP